MEMTNQGPAPVNFTEPNKRTVFTHLICKFGHNTRWKLNEIVGTHHIFGWKARLVHVTEGLI